MIIEGHHEPFLEADLLPVRADLRRNQLLQVLDRVVLAAAENNSIIKVKLS